jgi:gamma-glutamyltranspeptidase/glutathione hydrolase
MTKLHGAVASESTICSGIGRDLLLRGGTAADAMVGTVFCVGVIGMQHSGVGGGGFMLVRGSDGEYEFIDFRETAPAAAFQDMYKNNTNASIYGGLARYAWTDENNSNERQMLTFE